MSNEIMSVLDAQDKAKLFITQIVNETVRHAVPQTIMHILGLLTEIGVVTQEMLKEHAKILENYGIKIRTEDAHKEDEICSKCKSNTSCSEDPEMCAKHDEAIRGSRRNVRG